jgi:hypothetical protein
VVGHAAEEDIIKLVSSEKEQSVYLRGVVVNLEEPCGAVKDADDNDKDDDDDDGTSISG